MGEADWPTSAQKSLAKYVQAYIAEFNALRGELERFELPASLYGKELVAAMVLLASDGAVVVYYDRETSAKVGLEQGVLLLDLEDETLTHFTQSRTANLLKITISKAGDDIRILPQIPDDIPREELKGGINPEVLAPYLGHLVGPTLIGMAVGPQWQFEKGIRTRMLPTRGRVFSPVVKNPPDGRPVLQFIFPFLDLIWLLDELQLNAELGRQWARADIEVLLLGIVAGIPQKQLAEDPFDAVATHCERVCDNFFRLIDNPETRETDVQNFLEVPANQFLVAPTLQRRVPSQTAWRKPICTGLHGSSTRWRLPLHRDRRPQHSRLSSQGSRTNRRFFSRHSASRGLAALHEGVPFLVEQAKRLPYGGAVRTTNRQPYTERSRFMKSVIRITKQGKVKNVPPTNLTTVPALDEVDTTVACIQALIPIALKAVEEELSKELIRLAGLKHSRTGGLPGVVRYRTERYRTLIEL